MGYAVPLLARDPTILAQKQARAGEGIIKEQQSATSEAEGASTERTGL